VTLEERRDAFAEENGIVREDDVQRLAGERLRRVVGVAERRELLFQARHFELEDALRLGEPAQPVLPELARGELLGKQLRG
jgi:hypothetical protein